MSLTLSSATPEVRTVPTCSDLSENAHTLLAHLTRTRGKNKGFPRVNGDRASWASATGLSPMLLDLAYDEIRPESDNVPGAYGFLTRDKYGRLVLALLCECPAERKADSSIPLGERETEQSGSGGLPELATPVSSDAPCGRKSNPQKGDKTPGQRPETCFPEMADEKDEDPRPRRNASPDSPFGLANYFVERVNLSATRQGVRLMPGSINRGALRRHISVLLTELPPAEVRAFIDHFAKGYRRYHKPGVDPGKVFLARRRGLYEEFRKAKTFTTERDINKIQANGRRYTTVEDLRRKQK